MPSSRIRVDLVAAVSVTLLATAAAAQVPTDPVVLRERLDDKLAAPFLRLAVWHTDLAEAQRAAARDGKLILAHCTRSFIPCGTSIRCEREVLGSPEFARVAQRVVLYCHVSAHVDPAGDRFLFDTRGSGWPHHVVLDATGRVLGTHESHRDKSVAELMALVDRAEAYRDVEAQTQAAIEDACRRRLRAGLEAGALDLGEARRLFARCGTMPAEEAREHAGKITDLEVADVLRRHDRFDERTHAAAGAELFALWRQGKRPHARNAVRDFWGGILLWLEQQEKPDLAVYREGLAQLEELLGETRGYKTFLESRRKALAERERAAVSPGDTKADTPRRASRA